ncbi:MAG TPA: hypothetical protein VKK81_19220 [Candidatus Binatia bacterium]|nr:hypothetical protein [Candidatus Binatia bacterium]
MLCRCLAALLFLSSLSAFAGAQAPPEPQVPLGARWTLPLEQAQQLPSLERASGGSLKASHTIRSNSQVELAASWQGRTVSLLFARGFGLYAIGVEMTPWAAQHSSTAADPEQQDLEQCAPIRLAILRKYGPPQGMTEAWDAMKVVPLTTNQRGATDFTEAGAIDWPYGRNWLIWEGEETRLALGEQFVWYVSKAGLVYREKARQALEKESLAVQAQDKARLAQRQLQVGRARQAVLSRSQGLEELF